MNQTAHSLEVTAETLFEAIAEAIVALHGNDWVGEIGRGLTTVSVTVRHPEVTHVVKIMDFEKWLNGPSKSPAEIMLKVRLREILGSSDQRGRAR